jgi:membrane fusion protein (multidrug efflux system)
MKSRMVRMVGAMVLLILALGTLKFFQIRAAIAQYANYTPPPEAVTTVIAGQESWAATLRSIGSVVAVQGVTVSADLPGVIGRIAFESGAEVSRGALLVQLDTSQERAQLAAAESALKLARLRLERFTGLREKRVAAQAELDEAQAEAEQADARVGEIRATIERKTLRAPFAGRLGIRQVNVGQYVQSGDPIVPLQALDPIHVDFDVPQQAVTAVAVGRDVHVTAEGVAGELTGQVSAIDSVIDESTRSVRVRVTLANPEGKLRPGMFVEAHMAESVGQSVIPIPASAVAYAPYGDSVFVVGDLEGPDGKSYRGVRQQFVKLGPGRGDQVAVLSGIEAGAEVVSSGVFKLRNGAAVLVDNQTQPGNDPAPEPEDS